MVIFSFFQTFKSSIIMTNKNTGIKSQRKLLIMRQDCQVQSEIDPRMKPTKTFFFAWVLTSNHDNLLCMKAKDTGVWLEIEIAFIII